MKITLNLKSLNLWLFRNKLKFHKYLILSSYSCGLSALSNRSQCFQTITVSCDVLKIVRKILKMQNITMWMVLPSSTVLNNDRTWKTSDGCLTKVRGAPQDDLQIHAVIFCLKDLVKASSVSILCKWCRHFQLLKSSSFPSFLCSQSLKGLFSPCSQTSHCI